MRSCAWAPPSTRRWRRTGPMRWSGSGRGSLSASTPMTSAASAATRPGTGSLSPVSTARRERIVTWFSSRHRMKGGDQRPNAEQKAHPGGEKAASPRLTLSMPVQRLSKQHTHYTFHTCRRPWRRRGQRRRGAWDRRGPCPWRPAPQKCDERGCVHQITTLHQGETFAIWISSRKFFSSIATPAGVQTSKTKLLTLNKDWKIREFL